MKTLICALFVSAVMNVRGEKLFNWQDGTLPGAAKLGANGVLVIANTNDAPLRAELLRVENPGVSAPVYALRGRIKYDGVKGDGFLEMWSVFPASKEGAPEPRYFSRTMAVSGEMGKITGSSAWREFQLPFNRTGSAAPPKRLEVNLVLAGSGTIYLEPMKLVEYGSGFGGQSDAWWSDRTAGLFGGIGGAVVGCLGSLLAVLAAKRKAKRFVLAAAFALIGLGCAAALAGVVALGLHQPYAVWFPLILGAVLLLSIVPSRLREMRRNYENHELRRMAALDAGQV